MADILPMLADYMSENIKRMYRLGRGLVAGTETTAQPHNLEEDAFTPFGRPRK
jgi:hypothetical protein